MSELLAVATALPTVEVSTTATAEYTLGLEVFRHWSGVRRQDMVFTTTVQGAVFTILGKNVLQLHVADFALSCIAFFVVVLGFNSERRVAAYMRGAAQRLKEVEPMTGMALFSAGATEVARTRGLAANAKVFMIYYLVLGLAWLFVWAGNLTK
jgi:hypothetical protein